MVHNDVSVCGVKDQETEPHIHTAMYVVNYNFRYESSVTTHNTVVTYFNTMRDGHDGPDMNDKQKTL